MIADTLTIIGLATIALGTIQEADGPVEHTFWLRNDGTETVVLHQGYTSCGCTTITFEQGRQLAPRDSADVRLRFNPRGKGGEFLETATIVYGPRRRRIQMALEGTCQTSEETLMRQYPVRISDRLRLSTDHFDLGRLAVGESRQRSLAVLIGDAGGQRRQERVDISFTVKPTTPKGLQHIDHPVEITLDDSRRQTVTIRLDVFVK